MKRGRAWVLGALAAATPLAILAACGSNNFSSDGSDAAVVTGEGDATGGDSQTTPADAGADAPPAPTWCQLNAPTALFCADFDEGDLTAAYHKGVLTKALLSPKLHEAGVPGETLILDDAGLSGPSSASTYTPEFSTPGLYENVALTTAPDYEPSALGFSIDFDVRVGIQGNIDGELFALFLTDLTNTDQHNDYEIQIGEGVSQFEVAVTDNTLGPRPTVGVWTHYHFVVPLVGANVVASEQGGSLMSYGPSGVESTTTQAQIEFGQFVAAVGSAAGATQISFDNVVVAFYEPDAGDGG